MKRDLQKMMNTELGILIIGGGITGAGIARDAANRGIKVAVVEKNDFACGTTSRSTIMRYGAFSILDGVSGSTLKGVLQERTILQFIAKDITQPIQFIAPTYSDDKRKLSPNQFGFTLYNMFAGAKKVQTPQTMNPEDISRLETNLSKENLTGGTVYDDIQIQPERLVICNLWDAFEHGAQIANHCEAVSFLQENGKVIGVVVKDLLDGKEYEIKAKVVVNATGPWVDKTREILISKSSPSYRGIKEINLIVPKITDKAFIFSSKVNNQIIYVIPYNEYSLIGKMTFDFQGNIEDLHVTEVETNTLLEQIKGVFPQCNLQKTDILFSYAGIQPSDRNTNVIKPRQPIEETLISICSGELPLYRLLAKKVVDVIHSEYSVPQERKCQSDIQPLLYQKFPSEQEAYLRLQDVFEKSPALNTLFKNEKVVKAHEYKFRVALACELEMARTPADFLLRRSNYGYRKGLGMDILPIIAEHMGSFLGWKPEEKQAQIDTYKSYVTSNFSIS